MRTKMARSGEGANRASRRTPLKNPDQSVDCRRNASPDYPAPRRRRIVKTSRQTLWCRRPACPRPEGSRDGRTTMAFAPDAIALRLKACTTNTALIRFDPRLDYFPSFMCNNSALFRWPRVRTDTSSPPSPLQKLRDPHGATYMEVRSVRQDLRFPSRPDQTDLPLLRG